MSGAARLAREARRPRAVLLALTGLLVPAILLSACGGSEPGEEAAGEEGPDGEAAAEGVVTVRTSALDLAGLTETTPRPGRLARTVMLVGELRYDPSRRTEVRTPAPGRFDLTVAAGDRVRRGDALGHLASPETYPDSVSLTAPRDGRLLDLPSGPAGLVDAWSPVAVVASTDTLRLVVRVPADRQAGIREGTPLRVAAGPDADPTREGRAVRVTGFLAPVKGAAPLRATARVPNPAGRLAPGMRVPVALGAGDSLAGHWLPESSVLYARRRPDRTVVFLRQGGGYVQADVEVGGRTADSVFVTSGVEDGDTVVAEGSYQLLYADFSFRGIGAEAGEMEEGEEDDGGP